MYWLQKDSGYSQAEKKTILEKLSEWLLEIIDKIRELVAEEHLNDVSKEFANAQAEQFAEVRQKFLQVLDEIEGVEGAEGVKRSVKAKKIVREMSDAERAEILNTKTLQIVAVNDVVTNKVGLEREQLTTNKLKLADAKKLLRKIGVEFGAFDKYSNPDLEIEFEFGKNNLGESVNKQKGSYISYLQMLSCFSDVINNAVGVEVHNRNDERYKVDKTLKNVYVLLSAFENDKYIIPVKLEVKEFSDKPNRLYVAVTLEGIKKDRVVSVGVPNTRSHVRTSPVDISIPDLISKINPKDIDFLKYIPDELLTSEQIKSKQSTVKHSYKLNDIQLTELTEEKRKVDKEIFSLRRQFDDLKKTDDYERLETAVVEARGNDEAFNSAIDEYNEWIKSSGMGEINRKLTEARGEAFGYTDTLDRYFELQSNVTRVFNEIEKRRRRSSDDLYRSTAGEIEARDASKRLNMTAEERKNTRPDIDRKDVVFADGGVSYEIKTDIDGNKFVEVDKSLFDAKSGESHAKTIARIIKDRFSNLISVNGQQIQINKTTNDEWRRSRGANALKKRYPQGYDDKLKTIPNADEILKIAKNWIGEELHHPRNDDIVEFARGNVYYRVGNEGYVADVIVAIRKNGSAVLYDLDDIRSKKITDIPLTMASENSQRSAGIPVTSTIPQTDNSVKSSRKFSLDWIDFAEEQERERSAVSELTELKKINEELRAQIRHPGVRHIVSQLGVQKVARYLKSEYMSKINIHKLSGELGDCYTLIANGDGISWDSTKLQVLFFLFLAISKKIYPFDFFI